MRLSYYGYFLRHKIHFGKHLVDLSMVIKSFAECNEPKLKGAFRHNEESVFVKKLTGDTCLIAMTRNSEHFKKIDTKEMSISEVSNLLTAEEKIGFVSYAVVKPYFFGYASTSLSPKFDTFTAIINNLLSITGNGSWELCIHPLIHQATKDEAVKMDFIGKTTIEVRRENTLCQEFLNVLNAGSDSEDVESLEITIKPTKRKNIKRVVEKLISHTSDEGLERLVVKAKNDAHSSLVDLYVVGRGVISDIVNSADESVIPGLMEVKIQENEKLQVRLAEFVADGQADQADLSGILHYNNVSTWAALAADLQQDYKLRP